MRIPSLRRHSTGCGTVRLNGRDYYFVGAWPEGREAPPDIRAQYDRRIAEWLAGGRKPPTTGGLTLAVLAARYLQHCETYYRDPEGQPTGSAQRVAGALTPLLQAYGDWPVDAFRAEQLQTILDQLTARGLVRRTINHYLEIYRAMLRWGAEPTRRYVPASVLAEAELVQKLKPHRSQAKETEPVQPPPDRDIERMLLFAPDLADMVGLQLLTAMRPGELIRLHADEIDQRQIPWLHVPRKHKTRHRGKRRLIAFGPQARAILARLLAEHPGGFLFPNPHAIRLPHHAIDTYKSALYRACADAGVPAIRPNQLRHAALTRLRLAAGRAAASAQAGHASEAQTETYTWTAGEILAQKIAEQFG